MSLSNDQIIILKDAIDTYDFPCAYFDFLNGLPAPQRNMMLVEKLIRDDLTSGDSLTVRNGLSNVLYWGYAQTGYRDTRIQKFRTDVTDKKLQEAATLFININNDGLKSIKNIGLPEFSGMSFITKIRMFLDPHNYVILDQQILKMKKIAIPTLLNEISFGESETQIRISQKNIMVYNRWCGKCNDIANHYFQGRYRAVDVERGFFNLIQKKKERLAATILSAA